MKRILILLAIGTASVLFGAFGSGNTIILSGWPVADASVAGESAAIALEAGGAAVATATLTDFDGRAFASDARTLEGRNFTSSVGLILNVR